MKDYQVDEASATKIREQLEERKNPKPSSSSQTKKLTEFAHLDLDKSGTIDFSAKTDKEKKDLFAAALNKGLHGICFSPYEEGQDIQDSLTSVQIERRINLVKPYTKWLRSFSCTGGNELTPAIAHKHGLKTMVGAWIGSDKSKNEEEIESLIRMAKKGEVDIAVVGNEVLLREELSETELIAYIKRVKSELPEIPVAYVDAYYQFHERPAIVDACDVILVNCYPFWEGCTIDTALAYLKQMYNVAKGAAKGKPVIITETGWPNKGDSIGQAIPSITNAMQYFVNVNNWANEQKIPLFYFSSFDESWKVHQEGDVGARWGVWDKKEQLKY